MNIQLGIAQAIGAASEWGLKNVFGRPAANFPGKVGLYADLRPRIREGGGRRRRDEREDDRDEPSRGRVRGGR